MANVTGTIAQPDEPTPEQFMRRALALSELAVKRGDGMRYGAVIVKEERIVGEGWNRIYANHDPTAHGEVEAIRDACRRLGTPSLDGCVIYTTHGHPCPMCEAACYWANIDRIYHASDAASITDAGSPEYERC